MVFNNLVRFWMVVAGSFLFCMVLYGDGWFWPVLDGGGRFWPTCRLFSGVLT